MKKVIISHRAFLSMLAEVYEHVETETGGIFLGHRDNDTWYVLESVEPGPESIFTPSYFEYDDEYVTYRANKISRLYKKPLQLLGLWHRHPGLLKTFSSTDDGTNKTYTDMLNGAISGLVTLGNGFEITMYYVPHNVRYERIEWEVNDNLIPKEYLTYYSTQYYANIINEASGYRYRQSSFNFDDEQFDDEEYADEQYADENSVPNANQTPHYQNREYVPEKRSGGFFGWVVDSITDRISALFDDYEEYDEEDTASENYEEEPDDSDSDIAFIFDTIEPEIEYLQKLEKTGDVKASYLSKVNQKGKEFMFIEIVDARQEVAYTHQLALFVQNDTVMIRNISEGTNQVYNGNIIHFLLGGNA